MCGGGQSGAGAFGVGGGGGGLVGGGADAPFGEVKLSGCLGELFVPFETDEGRLSKASLPLRGGVAADGAG